MAWLEELEQRRQRKKSARQRRRRDSESSEADDEASDDADRRRAAREERSRNRRKKGRDEEDDRRARVARRGTSSRRPPVKTEPTGVKTRNKAVAAVERAIKDLVLRMDEAVEDITAGELESFRLELLSIKSAILAIKPGCSYLFRSSTGKYLSSIQVVLDTVQDRYQLEVSQFKDLVFDLKKELARIVVNTVRSVSIVLQRRGDSP